MGLPSRFSNDARRGHGPGGSDDPRSAQRRHRRRRSAAVAGISLFLAAPLLAEPLKIASYSAALSRDGPGILLRDILDHDEQTTATVQVIAASRPDILLLTEIDHDLRLRALTALQNRLVEAGHPMPHAFASAPNTGLETPFDLNRNGHLFDLADAWGFGKFRGDGGMAILSRYPINTEAAQNFSTLMWAELPKTQALPDEAGRLSTTAHWSVPIQTPDGPLTVLAFAATAPIFDGPEDRNGRRGGDETRFWLHHLDGNIGVPPDGAFVIMGRANIDPVDGEGDHTAIRTLLDDTRLQDPLPHSLGAAAVADTDHAGAPALDTADWPDGNPGNLRVTYVLPSADLSVTGSGVVWPDAGPLADAAALAGPHRMVWVQVDR